MSRKLTVAQREEFGREAWRMSAMGYGISYIAKTLCVNPKTVVSLLEQERLKRRAEWKEEDLKSVEFYEGEMRWCIHKRKRILAKGGYTAQNITGLTNAAITARQQIDRIVGTHAPTRTDNRHKVEVEYVDLSGASEGTVREIEEYLAQLDS